MRMSSKYMEGPSSILNGRIRGPKEKREAEKKDEIGIENVESGAKEVCVGVRNFYTLLQFKCKLFKQDNYSTSEKKANKKYKIGEKRQQKTQIRKSQETKNEWR